VGIVLTLILAFLAKVLLSVAASELKEWTPWLVKRLIDFGARRQPEDRQERAREEWASWVNETPGTIGKYWVAFSFVRSAITQSAKRRTQLLSLSVVVMDRHVAWSKPWAVAFLLSSAPFWYLAFRSEQPPFDGYRTPVPLRLYVTNGSSCGEWDRILSEEHHGRRLINFTIKQPCRDLGVNDNPIGGVSQVFLILDPLAPLPGSVGEFRKNRTRSFVVRFNPRTMTNSTLAHELGHILMGHTAIGANLILNTAADIQVEAYALRWHVLLILLILTVDVFSLGVWYGCSGSRSPISLFNEGPPRTSMQARHPHDG
jgi:hypothetical protein